MSLPSIQVKCRCQKMHTDISASGVHHKRASPPHPHTHFQSKFAYSQRTLAAEKKGINNIQKLIAVSMQSKEPNSIDNQCLSLSIITSFSFRKITAREHSEITCSVAAAKWDNSPTKRARAKETHRQKLAK